MNKFDTDRNAMQLMGKLSRHGYMRWWHSFRGLQPETGIVRTFFIEYFVINPALGGDRPILSQMPKYKNRGIKSSYALVKAGVFPDVTGLGGKQICSYYSMTEYQATDSPLHLFMGNCECSESHISGDVYASHAQSQKKYLFTDSGSMEWDLEVSKAIACNTGILGSLFATTLGVLDNYWHGEGIKTYYRGTVILDGIPYTIIPDDCNGYADKHWGKKYNRPWIQLACSDLFSEKNNKQLKHSALAIDGCSPKFLFFPLRKKLMLQFTYTGEDFEFNIGNSILNSKCKWKLKKTNKRYIWHIYAKNKTALIKISGFSLKESMMNIHYEGPDGSSVRSINVGNSGCGTIELYRIVDGEKQLIDKIQMNNALWEYND